MSQDEMNKASWEPGEDAGYAQPAKKAEESKAQSEPAVSVSPESNNLPQEYEDGCCRAAWSDIRATRGWFGKVLFLALVEYIPILNWVVRGFAMRWSRQLFFGKVEEMPKRVFADRAFVNGAMYFLVSLVVGIVTAMASLILGLIPIVGLLLGLAVSIFVGMFMNICYARMAIFDQLGDGFSINKGFFGMKKQAGKAFCVEFLPGFIIGLILFVFISLLVITYFCGNGLVLYAQYDEVSDLIKSYGSINDFWNYLLQDTQLQLQINRLVMVNIMTLVPYLIIGSYLSNVATVIFILIKFRASAHYVTRYCQEWKEEQKFQTVLQCEGR